MKERLTRADLERAAERMGMQIKQEPDGYRIERDGQTIFPNDTSTESKRGCMGFLYGVAFTRADSRAK